MIKTPEAPGMYSSHLSSLLLSSHSPIKSTLTLQPGEGKVCLLLSIAFFSPVVLSVELN